MKKIIVVALYALAILFAVKFIWLGVDLVQNYDQAINLAARYGWVCSYAVKAMVTSFIADFIDGIEIHKVEG